MRDVIATSKAPQAVGPYSQAIRAGGFIFVSGQIAIDPANGQIAAGGIAAQTERALYRWDVRLQGEDETAFFNL